MSQGCKNCYMFREQTRYGRNPEEVVRAAPATFNAPLKWREPARVFTCSWSDFFIEEADAWRAEAWDIIRRTPHLTYQVLTKRAERIAASLPADWGAGWPNVWLGVTVETAKELYRADILAVSEAATRFISYEPALGPLTYKDLLPLRGFIHWLIAGGESGPMHRIPMEEWFVEVRDACKQLDIAFFFKQNGGTKKIDGVAGGQTLRGQVYHEFPA